MKFAVVVFLASSIGLTVYGATCPQLSGTYQCRGDNPLIDIERDVEISQQMSGADEIYTIASSSFGRTEVDVLNSNGLYKLFVINRGDGTFLQTISKSICEASRLKTYLGVDWGDGLGTMDKKTYSITSNGNLIIESYKNKDDAKPESTETCTKK